MSDELIRRVDALVRRQEPSAAKGEVPVLTDIVTEDRAPRRPMDDAAPEALARELERAVLERLEPEINRVIEERLGRALNTVLGQAVEGVRGDITVAVRQTVREAVAASVTFALPPKTPE
jgi:hypothetical protein